MKTIVLLSILLFTLQGCTDDQYTNTPTDYHFACYDLSFTDDTEALVTNLPLEYSVSVHDSIFTLRYVFQKDSPSSDTVSYTLKADQKFKPSYHQSSRERREFVYVAHQTFTINNTSYKVYKYASNPFITDRCVSHFWTPEFGIILIRSTVWKNFRKLQTNKPDLNRKINQLADLIYQNSDFYKGCTEVKSTEEFDQQLLENVTID